MPEDNTEEAIPQEKTEETIHLSSEVTEDDFTREFLEDPSTAVSRAKDERANTEQAVLRTLLAFEEKEGLGVSVAEFVLAAAVCPLRDLGNADLPPGCVGSLLGLCFVTRSFFPAEPFPPKSFTRPDGLVVTFRIERTDPPSDKYLLYVRTGGYERPIPVVPPVPGAPFPVSHLCLTADGRKMAKVFSEPPQEVKAEGSTAAGGEKPEPQPEPENLFQWREPIWEVRYKGSKVVRILDQAGMGALKALLSKPGHEWTVQDLLDLDTSQADEDEEQDGAGSRLVLDRTAGGTGREGAEVVDPSTVQAVHARIAEIAEEKKGKAGTAWDELDDEEQKLKRYLKSAENIQGTSRTFPTRADRDADALSHRLSRCMDAIGDDKKLPALAEHLKHSIRLGSHPLYHPREVTNWTVE